MCAVPFLFGVRVILHVQGVDLAACARIKRKEILCKDIDTLLGYKH